MAEIYKSDITGTKTLDELTNQDYLQPVGDANYSSSTADTEEFSSSLLKVSTATKGEFLKSDNFVEGVSGWRIWPTSGDAQFNSLTITGGTIKYGKTSFTDSTNAGYFISSSGMYFGSASDAKYLKYTISSGDFVLNGNNFAIDLGGTVRIGSLLGNYILHDGPNTRIRSSNYSTGVSGFTIETPLIEAENLIARGTMRGTTFAYDIVNAVGGQLLVANASTMDSDMTDLDASTMTIKGDTTFAVGDILVIRNVASTGIEEEWMRIVGNIDKQETDYNSDIGFYVNYWLGQQFIAGVGSLSEVALYFKKVGSPTGNLTISIQGDNGSDYPNGTDLAVVTVDSSAISTSYSYVTFSLPTSLTIGNKYWIVAKGQASWDISNDINWGSDNATPSNYRAYGVGSFSTHDTTESFNFKTYYSTDPTYTVTRDLLGLYTANNNPAWKAGTPVVKNGNTQLNVVGESMTKIGTAFEIGNREPGATTLSRAQSFVATYANLTSIIVKKLTTTNTPTNSLIFTLEADNAGNPSGTPLATISYTQATWDALENGEVTVLLAYTLVVGSTYWIVAKDNSEASTAYYNLDGSTSGDYSAGGQSYSLNSGSTWTAQSGYDLYFKTNYTTYSGGWLKMLGEGTNSPYYSVIARTGVNPTDYTEYCRMGNLNGFLGYSTDSYGFAAGDNTGYMKYDPTNGVRIAGTLSVGSIPSLPNDTMLTARWSFDENSGTTVYDYSNNSKHGSISGASFTTGISGSALSFDGTNDYVDVPYTVNSAGQSAISYSLWFKWDGTGGGADGSKFLIESQNTYAISLCITNDASPKLRAYVLEDYSGGTVYSTDSTTTIVAGTWYFVSVTYEKNNLVDGIKLYLDGIKESSTPVYGGAVYASTGLSIGTYRNKDNRWFGGIIDEVRLYSKVLTEYEIFSLYKNPTGLTSVGVSPDKGLVGGWTINATTLSNGTNIILDASNKAISINDSTFGNSGIQLQYNGGTPRAYIGDGSSKYFKWDGTNLTVKATKSNLMLYETVVDAAGDGDYTSIQSAISAGKKRIFVRNGSYSLSGNISLQGDNISIIGETMGGVSINLYSYYFLISADTGFVYTAGTITLTNGSATVTGAGTGFSSGAVGMYLFAGGGVYLVSGYTDSTTITISTTYKGKTIASLPYHILTIQSNLILKNLSFTGSDGYLSLGRSNGGEISNLKFSNFSGGTGIIPPLYMNYFFLNNIKNIYFENNSNSAQKELQLEESDCNKLENIFCYNNMGAGISVDTSSSYNTISNCVCCGNDYGGISIFGNYNSVLGCVTRDNGVTPVSAYGIYIISGDRNIVANNISLNNKTANFQDSGTNTSSSNNITS